MALKGKASKVHRRRWHPHPVSSLGAPLAGNLRFPPVIVVDTQVKNTRPGERAEATAWGRAGICPLKVTFLSSVVNSWQTGPFSPRGYVRQSEDRLCESESRRLAETGLERLPARPFSRTGKHAARPVKGGVGQCPTQGSYRTLSSRMTGGSPHGADRFAGQPEIAAPVHTAGIADGTAMVLRLASSGRSNARVLGRSPGELVFRVSAGRSLRTIVRRGLLEESVLSGGSGGPGRLRPGELPSPSPVEGVEGLGHDAGGAGAAVSAGVGGMIAAPALCVRHGRSPRGKSEDLTIPFPSFSPQGLTVSNSTHNAGSQKAHLLISLIPLVFEGKRHFTACYVSVLSRA